jgi:hypothetical protein
MWEDGLAAFEHALGRERDTEHAQVEAAWQDYLARSCTFTSSSKHSIKFNRMLEERHILFFLQEIDLEWREAKLAEEARGPHSFIGQDLLAELKELRVHVARV